MESCYACRNGENIWGHPCFTGNASAFKLGEGSHVLIRCVAWDHRATGFLRGNPTRFALLYCCTAVRDGCNYAFWRTYGNEKDILRNNLSYKGHVSIGIDAGVHDQFNSWNTPPGLDIT